jgi:hypothetical protein
MECSNAIIIDRQAIINNAEAQLIIESKEGQQLGIIRLIEPQQQINSQSRDSLLITQQADESLVKQAGTSDLISPVVQVSLVAIESQGQLIEIQPTTEIEICLLVNSTETQNKRTCLSFIDTSVNPPEWKCQDECLIQVSPSFWCGKTSHFTNFAVLLTGDQSNDRQDECDKGAYYIFDEWYWDGLLALSVALVVIFVF